MTTSRLLIPILVAALCGGVAHAGEFSPGGGYMLAQNNAQTSDVNVTFTDRGRSLHEAAEGGDSMTHNARTLRGADDAATPATRATRAVADPPAAKSADQPAVTSDSPHGVSISPAAAIRRPSYRWQSLVPGTIK